MGGKKCNACLDKIEEWNHKCESCGYHLVLEPDERSKVRFLRGPSLGALLWTQGWTFGARLYFWFLISLIPVFGLIALFACMIFGRRWAWKYGGWEDWQEFKHRMLFMDILGGVWVCALIGGYLWLRLTGRS
jgi:hypothetical protein